MSNSFSRTPSIQQITNEYHVSLCQSTFSQLWITSYMKVLYKIGSLYTQLHPKFVAVCNSTSNSSPISLIILRFLSFQSNQSSACPIQLHNIYPLDDIDKFTFQLRIISELWLAGENISFVELNKYLHILNVYSHWKNKCWEFSPLNPHKEHLSAKTYPFFFKFSNVSTDYA